MTIFRCRRIAQTGRIIEKYHVSGAGDDLPKDDAFIVRMLCGRVLAGRPTGSKELPKVEEAICRPCAGAFYRRRNAA